MELSVVSAIAASGGRSISKRLTSSAAEVLGVGVEPPLPQARSAVVEQAGCHQFDRLRDRRGHQLRGCVSLPRCCRQTGE